MNPRIRPLFAAAGMLAVTLLLALVSAPPATTRAAGGARLPAKPPPPPSPPAPVQVVNTPLPVTGTVAGTVQAQQHGTWNVGVSGTPNVIVANVPGVEAINDALYEPYNVSGSLRVPADADPVADLVFDIPAGKRLVIETVMVRLNMPTGQLTFWNAQLVTRVNDGTVVSPLALQLQRAHLGVDELAGTLSARMRVDGTGATDEIRARVVQPFGREQFFVDASGHGYLVDIPGAG
jgi:hypothetical protein